MEELQEQTTSTTTTIIEPKIEPMTRLEDLPSLDELKRSETEVIVKTEPQIQGLKKVEQTFATEDKVFKRKEDEKKVFLKRRLKIVTGVYIGVLTLLLGFVGVNLATLVILNKDINSNTNTIQVESARIEMIEGATELPTDPTSAITISLNEPRDYGDDKKELTFLDKITIMFRTLFT